MEEKVFIGAEELLADSFRLARKVYESGFSPDMLVAIWRGGTTVGIAVHEFLKIKGMSPFHIAIKAKSYEGFEQTGRLEVVGLDPVLERLEPGQKILLVDDVWDTGVTMEGLLSMIKERAGEKRPDVRVATVYFKPGRNRTGLSPDYYIYKDDSWLVFPHELEGLTDEELKMKNPAAWELLKESTTQP